MGFFEANEGFLFVGIHGGAIYLYLGWGYGSRLLVGEGGVKGEFG
jgi:hypothetical protein